MSAPIVGPTGDIQSVQRIYVNSKIRNEFVDRFVEGARKLHIGPPHAADTDISSLITEGEGKGTTMLGIYELQDDTMRVCFDPQGKERPTAFTPKQGQFGGVIKRAKK